LTDPGRALSDSSEILGLAAKRRRQTPRSLTRRKKDCAGLSRRGEAIAALAYDYFSQYLSNEMKRRRGYTD
jgi:hypothetical protein